MKIVIRDFQLVSSAVLILAALAGCAASNGSQPDQKPNPPMTSPTPSGQGTSSSCSQGIFAPAEGVQLEARKEPWLIRQRAVRIDFATLDNRPTTMALNLFDDACLVAVRDSAAASEGGVWTGSIQGVPNSNVTLVTNARTVIGTIVSPPHAFQIRALRDDIHVVNQVDQSKYPREK